MSRRPMKSRNDGAAGRRRTALAPAAAGSGLRTALATCLLVTSAASADEIRTTTRARYISVRIEDVQNGKVVFRDVQGRTMDRAITEVATLSITGWEAFNRAEGALAAKQYRQAGRAFEAILRDVEQAGPDAGRPKHRRELVLARLAAACDGEGRFDRAVECYVALCKAWGASAAGLEPRNIPAKESGFYTAAIALLTTAAEETGQTAAGEQLRRYRSRLEGAAITRPATRPAKANRRALEQDRQPDSQLTQVAEWIEAHEIDRAMPAVQAALRNRPVERLAPWYYWQGRCLEASAKTHADRLRAALAYMRVPVHYPDDPQCAECLYRAAILHVRTGHADRAAGLLREALRRSPGDDLKRQCEAAIAGAGE